MNEVWLNSNDRLVLFGYGLFETLRVNPNGIEVPHLHWERMSSGGEVLGLEVPGFPHWIQAINEFLASIHYEAIESNAIQSDTFHPHDDPFRSFALRLTLSGGTSPALRKSEHNSLGSNSSKLLFHPRPIPYTPSHYEQGVELILLSSPRNEHSILTKIKSTNYLENLYAREQAQRQGAFDGLWLNTQGQLVETTMSNLFFVKEGILHTPSLSCGCLPGTRRTLVLQTASSLGIPVYEGAYRPDALFEAEEVFLTNALMGIMPVCKINEHLFRVPSSDSDSVTSQLVQAYQEMRTK